MVLYFPFTTEYYPSQSPIEKLSLTLYLITGVSIDIYDLKPVDDMTDINCADTVLCFQKFEVCGQVVFKIRNQEKNIQVVL